MDYNKLSLEEKVGQKFIFGINSDNINIIVNLIEKHCIGGVILYKKNYNNYDEMLSVVKRLKNANRKNKIPLFVAIDQEGGRVNRMPPEFKNLKNVYDMSRKNESLITGHANFTGKMLNETGINMNFAPVMDVYDEDTSKVLYKRCFYGDVDDVCRLGKRYVRGLSYKGVLPVVKHFPGHGATSMDSHFWIPYVYDYNKVLERHILPFENAIKNKDDGEIDAIMVNHMVIRRMTGGVPASISALFIEEYLRKRNSFSGLVITDEINMLSRNPFYRFNYMKKAFFSGSDIILVKIKRENEAIKMINKYIKFVNSDKECMKLLEDSVKRIIKIKDKYNINDDIDYCGSNVDEINEEIDRINNLCVEE